MRFLPSVVAAVRGEFTVERASSVFAQVVIPGVTGFHAFLNQAITAVAFCAVKVAFLARAIVLVSVVAFLAFVNDAVATG